MSRGPSVPRLARLQWYERPVFRLIPEINLGPQLGDLFSVFVCSLSRVEPQRVYDAPVTYGAMMVPVISRRTRSSDPCIVVGLVVHAWCECGVCG
jgi:hypothetical protein